MEKKTWYESIKLLIDESDNMSATLVSEIKSLLEHAKELSDDKGAIKNTIQALGSSFDKDDTNQLISVTWQDKVFYYLYKLCNDTNFYQGKEFFKSLISTQAFVVLAGKDLSVVVDKKINESMGVVMEHTKNIGGIIKEGVEALLNKANDKDSNNKNNNNKNK